MKKPNIGLHYVDNIYSIAERTIHYEDINILKPNYINILGGMQHEQAVNMALTVRQNFPNTQVIFRHYKDGSDDGMWTRLSPLEWVEKIAKQYLGYDLIILTDNESVQANMRPYADWMATAIMLSHAEGLRIAVGRFATGNVDDGSKYRNQYPDLEPMFHAMAQYQNAIFSPNEYFDKIGGGVGSIGRYKKALPYYYKYTSIPIKVVIGEFGLAYNYDPHRGYLKAGIKDTDYGKELIRQFELYYLQDNVNACVFSRGTWNGFEINAAILSMLSSYNLTLLENEGCMGWKVATINIKGDLPLRVRAEPNASSEILGKLNDGQRIEYCEESKNLEWLEVVAKTETGQEIHGYAFNSFIEFVTVETCEEKLQRANSLIAELERLIDEYHSIPE